MFATVGRYRVSAGSIEQMLHEVDLDFAESIQKMDGFIGAAGPNTSGQRAREAAGTGAG